MERSLLDLPLEDDEMRRQVFRCGTGRVLVAAVAEPGAGLSQQLGELLAMPHELARLVVALARGHAYAELVERVLERALRARDLLGQLVICGVVGGIDALFWHDHPRKPAR